jgi:hypothetical protein
VTPSEPKNAAGAPATEPPQEEGHEEKKEETPPVTPQSLAMLALAMLAA